MRNRRLSTVRNRAPDPEKITTLAELAALTQHPSWPALVRAVEEESEVLRKIVLANVLAPSGPIKTDEILQTRGFLKGMNYVLRVAAGAERNLEAELQKTRQEAS